MPESESQLPPREIAEFKEYWRHLCEVLSPNQLVTFLIAEFDRKLKDATPWIKNYPGVNLKSATLEERIEYFNNLASDDAPGLFIGLRSIGELRHITGIVFSDMGNQQQTVLLNEQGFRIVDPESINPDITITDNQLQENFIEHAEPYQDQDIDWHENYDFSHWSFPFLLLLAAGGE